MPQMTTEYDSAFQVVSQLSPDWLFYTHKIIQGALFFTHNTNYLQYTNY